MENPNATTLDASEVKSNRRHWLRAAPGARAHVTLFSEGREFHGIVVDVSHSGMLVACEELVPVGADIRVDLATPTRGMQVRGKVTRHTGRGSLRGMAVMLRGMGLQDRISLEAILEGR